MNLGLTVDDQVKVLVEVKLRGSSDVLASSEAWIEVTTTVTSIGWLFRLLALMTVLGMRKIGDPSQLEQ